MCLPHKATLERAKVVRTWCVFRILTSKRASCHNCVHFFGHLNFQKCFECEVFGMLTSKRASRQSGVCFFSISTSKSAPNVRCFFRLLISKRASRHSGVHSLRSEFPKVLQEWCALYMLISKCASGHKGVHFFERRKFQKRCLVHFDFEMCFAPQQRSLFQQINVPKKGSEMLRLLTFWLQNVVRAIAACNFWFLIQPDGSAPTALASLLFSLLEPQSNGNTQCFATFLPFRTPAPSFFWLLLFSNLLSSSFLFSDSSHLCFSICPYCRKFDFQTSFDNDNERVWKCACQLLLSQFEVLQPQGWQPYSLCFARGIAKAPRSPPTVVLCCRHRRWCWQPSRRFVWVCSGLFQVMFRFVDGGYAVSGGCVCVCVFPLCLAP